MINTNTVVLDLEVQHSPDWCRHCFKSLDDHGMKRKCAPQSLSSPFYSKIGWDDHASLGLSIGCWYDYANDRYHYFDRSNLEATMHGFLARECLIVTYNGKTFDLPLMATVGFLQAPNWSSLSARSYDVLHEIWEADPTQHFQKGNTLGAIAKTNGYGVKLESGAYAPELWRRGEHARVINYCTDDVWKTRMLFEQVCRGEAIRRLAGNVLLPQPTWSTP